MPEKVASREVTDKDLEVIDKTISSHEAFQTQLVVLRRVLGEIGKLDIAGIRRGVAAEQSRLDDVRQQADAAQADLTELQRQIESKQRELVAVEATIQERTIAANQLNESYLSLRNMLEAA
jgi:chromosome segregation ATPase